MRSSRDILAVAFLLLLFVAGGLLLGGRGAAPSRSVADDANPDPSISSDRGAGSKGAFDWIAGLGYRPAAWRRPWSALRSSDAALLLVIAPKVQEPMATLTGGGGTDDRTSLAARDARVLRRWLNSGSGHTAVLLTSRLESGTGGGASSEGDTETFGDALDLIVESSSRSGGATEFPPLQPVPETANVLSVHSTADARVSRRRPDALALFGDAAGPLALEAPVGRGRLVVVSDGALFSNGNLPRSENAVFLADLLARYAPPGGTVLFDEYHHGDVAAGGGSVWEALGRPLRLTLIQLGLAAVCLAVLLSGRFGPPVPLVRAHVRTSGEYVASLASLYRRAEASGTALETLYRQFLRDVCGRLALPPDVNLERLAAVAARRGQIDPERLRRLLATCELRLDQGKVSEAELLDLTRQMDGIRKDIGIA